jgi:wyosine [tRNA(Phe)-imidazoG37] synthetase (radical SAM superfamily)
MEATGIEVRQISQTEQYRAGAYREQVLLAMRDRVAPKLPLAILSNASTLASDPVAAAVSRIDECYMKLDAGDATLMRRVNGATLPFDTVVKGLRALPHVVIQTMFVRDRLGRIDNEGDLAVANWINTVRSIRPRAVHIYTIDREPAWPYLQPVAAARLLEIARRAQAAGLDAEAFVPTSDVAARGAQ